MPYIDESNFDAVFTPEMRNEFWRRVAFCLKGYFNERPAIADRYRDAVDSAPIGEQLLAYREDPLSAAAGLADAREVMSRHVAAYQKRYIDPARASPLLP